MPPKRDPYRSYGQKLITLFTKLLFTGRRYSLIELCESMDCSKQTVMRLIEDINMSYGVKVEESFIGRRKYYKLVKFNGSEIEPELVP